MTKEERNEYVKYRIESAHKTFEAAKHGILSINFIPYCLASCCICI